MRTAIRAMILLPVLIVALVAIPSAVMSAAGQSLDRGIAGLITNFRQSPLPTPTQTPGGTVPNPTPRPRPNPVYVAPTPTPEPVAKNAAFIERDRIEKVIGDRLSSTLYAFTAEGRLYRSSRDGYGWMLVTTRPLLNDFIMNAADPYVLYSGTGIDCTNPGAQMAPMYKSIDGGQSWQELPMAVNMKPLLTDQSNPDHVFAADCNTIYLSSDGGETWTPKPAAGINLWAGYVPADMASGSLVGDPPPDVPQWDQLFAIGNSAGGVGVVAFTGDRGDSWANITSDEEPPMGAEVVVAHLFVGGKLWVVDSTGVWSTVDYGVNWLYTAKGLETLTRSHGNALNDLTYGFNGRLYLATDIGLYEKEEAAELWLKSKETGFATARLTSLLLTETNPRILWINTDDGVFTYTVK